MQYGPEKHPPKGKKTPDYKLCILLLQTTAAAVVLLAALGLRFFGGELYLQLRQAYYGAVNDTTRVEEVLTPQSSQTEESSVPTPEQAAPSADFTLDFNTVQVAARPAKAANTLLWPVQGKVTSPYGYRNDPFTGQRAMHWGIDIGAATGTPIVAAAEGTVLKVAENDSYGKYIMVQHNENFVTLYAHCSAVTAKEGQAVSQGAAIARVGSTGRSTAPHLHFETRVGGQKINPQWLLGDWVAV